MAEQKELMVAALLEWEKSYLDPERFAVNRINPFRRVGVPLKQVASMAGMFKAEEFRTASGKLPVDLPAARKLMKQLLADGVVESAGAQRTLQCGSDTVDCYVLAGFFDRAEALADQLGICS